MTDAELSVSTDSDRVIAAFWAYAAGQSELGREFARRMRLHVTDSAAVVEIIRAEDRGVPLTPSRLAERVGLTSGATSIMLNRLEGAGHISRVRGHSDRRLATLHTSEAMTRASKAFFAPLRKQFDALTQRYTTEELKLIARFADELADTVEQHISATHAESAPPTGST